jgi:hypothetical protein
LISLMYDYHLFKQWCCVSHSRVSEDRRCVLAFVPCLLVFVLWCLCVIGNLVYVFLGTSTDPISLVYFRVGFVWVRLRPVRIVRVLLRPSCVRVCQLFGNS